MLTPLLTILVVKCVIPFLLLNQQRERKLCLSVCLSVLAVTLPEICHLGPYQIKKGYHNVPHVQHC